MPKRCRVLALGVVVCLLGCVATSTAQSGSAASDDEQKVWRLEHDYWRYVQDNDLAAYSNLWHKNFLGWPSVSAIPVGKDHITDWITSQAVKGLSFRAVEFKPANLHVTGDNAVAYYWMTFQWLDKAGKGDVHTMRITHTWLRTGTDWRIIGGMSTPEVAAAQK